MVNGTNFNNYFILHIYDVCKNISKIIHYLKDININRATDLLEKQTELIDKGTDVQVNNNQVVPS